jgi:hypothetical protein
MAQRPFPGHAVRDALALVRLLYIVANDGLDLDRTMALVDIGKGLSEALRMGRMDPRSLGYKAATRNASVELGKLHALGWSVEVSSLIRIAQVRVEGPPGPYVSASDLRKEMQRR